MSESYNEGPMQFVESGMSGTASTTIAGKANAIRRFNEFLKLKHLEEFDRIGEEEVCSISLFREFATYLTDFAKSTTKSSTSEPDSFLEGLSCVQIFSGVKNVTSSKFPGNHIWTTANSNLEWYTKCRCAIMRNVARQRGNVYREVSSNQ